VDLRAQSWPRRPGGDAERRADREAAAAVPGEATLLEGMEPGAVAPGTVATTAVAM
jgi:hypothetical protein